MYHVSIATINLTCSSSNRTSFKLFLGCIWWCLLRRINVVIILKKHTQICTNFVPLSALADNNDCIIYVMRSKSLTKTRIKTRKTKRERGIHSWGVFNFVRRSAEHSSEMCTNTLIYQKLWEKNLVESRNRTENGRSLSGHLSI